MSHPLESTRTWWIILAAFAVVAIGAITVLSVFSDSGPSVTPTPVGTLVFEPTITPHETRPRVTPTPTISPTPIPTPVPLPTPGPRWCETNTATNETICYQGEQPTPTPTPEPVTPTPVPTPTPTPVPIWIQKDYICEVPDRIVNEQWTVAYKYPCTCAIRAEFDLGLAFSPFEGCHQVAAWADASCGCVETICQSEPGLC